ncbi:MAG: GTP-binding protein [Candidatus Heimdallarchaeota archaeon]|nr:GTP-binding protein [Candidatus Heimdallarchaeota archaeon]
MSFLMRLFRNKTQQTNITVCGLDAAGKTTIMKYLETGEFVDTSPTMGINHEKIVLPKLQVNVFDLGGQEDFRPMWHEVNEKSDGIVFVVDKTDVLRFEEAKQAFDNIISTQVQNDVTVLVLLHKNDLPNGMERSKFIDEFGLSTLDYDWACYSTSAKTGENIFESFKWFVNELKEALSVG